VKDEKRIQVVVQGRVQGVGYRFFAQHQAVLYQLTGFVGNRIDASVVLEAQGEKVKLEAFLEQLKEGPRLAQVETVNVEWRTPEQDEGEFQIRF
jgi:acylphosphatase